MRWGDAVDVSGWTFLGNVRRFADQPGALATFVVQSSQAALWLVTLTLADSVTSTLPSHKPLTWDLQRTEAGEISTLMGGRFIVDKDVSR